MPPQGGRPLQGSDATKRSKPHGKHLTGRHPDVDISEKEKRRAEKYFTMEIHRRYNSAMEGQFAESLCIAQAGGMES